MLPSFELPYVPEFGFRVQVQRVHNLPGSFRGLVPYVVASMLPPGRLYQAKPTMGPDVNVYKDIDFDESRWNSVIFKDEMNLHGLQASGKLGIIFEVKGYDPRLKKDVEPQ